MSGKIISRLEWLEKKTGSNATPLTAEELASLEQMDAGGLRTLIKCLPAQITGYALQTKDERREAMRLRVYEIAMSASNDALTLKAANDWLDRDEGKAMQRQAIDARVSGTGGICPTCGHDPKLSFEKILADLDGRSLGLPQISDDND